VHRGDWNRAQLVQVQSREIQVETLAEWNALCENLVGACMIASYDESRCQVSECASRLLDQLVFQGESKTLLQIRPTGVISGAGFRGADRVERVSCNLPVAEPARQLQRPCSVLQRFATASGEHGKHRPVGERIRELAARRALLQPFHCTLCIQQRFTPVPHGPGDARQPARVVSDAHTIFEHRAQFQCALAHAPSLGDLAGEVQLVGVCLAEFRSLLIGQQRAVLERARPVRCRFAVRTNCSGLLCRHDTEA